MKADFGLQYRGNIMKQERKRKKMELGEQLMGLSPTVCRRAIAALRAADKALGGKKRKKDLPYFCRALIGLLGKEVSILFLDQAFLGPVENIRNDLIERLDQAEVFLDIVEGKISEEQLEAIVNPLTDEHEAAEETARRG